MSLGWDARLLANLFRLSLLPYCSFQRRTKKNIQQSTCASDAKNTRQFLWDDNSKWLQRAADKNPLRKKLKLHIQLVSVFTVNAARYWFDMIMIQPSETTTASSILFHTHIDHCSVHWGYVFTFSSLSDCNAQKSNSFMSEQQNRNMQYRHYHLYLTI